MCNRCPMYFTIHSAQELDDRLYSYQPKSHRLDTLKVWFERGYFTNLIYLEYLDTYERDTINPTILPQL